MHYTGITWRPPFEAKSLLLQVTSGCSHNKCTFCTMYSDVGYAVSPMQEIEQDLKEAANLYKKNTRVFLENGDAFSLSADRLLKIAELVNCYFPEAEVISSYASIKNLKDKSVEDLKKLKSLKVDMLNVGVESGLQSSLEFLNKGCDVKDVYEQIEKLKQAEMTFCLNIIWGVEGFGNYLKSAEANSKLLNFAQPSAFFGGTLHCEENCVLYERIKSGVFKENTARQLIEEEIAMIERLNLKNTHFYGDHPSNSVKLEGFFPRDKETFLQKLEKALKEIPPEKLDVVPEKGEEGEINL